MRAHAGVPTPSQGPEPAPAALPRPARTDQLPPADRPDHLRAGRRCRHHAAARREHHRPAGRHRTERRTLPRGVARAVRDRGADPARGHVRRRAGRAARGRGRGAGAADLQPVPSFDRHPDRPAGPEARHGRHRRHVRRPGDRHRPDPGARRGGLTAGHPRFPGRPVAPARADRRRRRQLHRPDRGGRTRRGRRGDRDRRQHPQEGRRAQPGAARRAPRPGRQRRGDGHGRRHHPGRRVPRDGRAAAHRGPRPDGDRRPVLRRGGRRADRPVPAQRVQPLQPRHPPPARAGLRAHRHRLGVPPRGAAGRGRGARLVAARGARRRVRHRRADRGQRAHASP